MYTDKDSKLISDLRTKYGEESVRTFRKWEITVKTMVVFRNHRRFMLKCIKASITPVSCKLKNPLNQEKVITSSKKQKNSYCMKELETYTILWKPSRNREKDNIHSLRTCLTCQINMFRMLTQI